MTLTQDKKYSYLKRKNRATLYTILFLGLILLYPAATTAGGVLNSAIQPINPQTEDKYLFYYEIKPGSTLEDVFWLGNFSDNENHVKVFTTHILENTAGEDSKKSYALLENLTKETRENVSKWITVENTDIVDFTLEPNKTRNVNFKIKVPKDTPPGIYKGGFALQKTSNVLKKVGDGANVQESFRIIQQIELNVTENPKKFVESTITVFKPTLFFWLVLVLFGLSVIYYIVSLQKKPKRS